MTNRTQTFKEAQGKLEEALARDQVDEKNRSQSLAAWRDYAGSVISDVSGGTVTIDDSTPEPAVARALGNIKSELDQRASGYWKAHKENIVEGIPQGKLAKMLFDVLPVAGDDKHNAAISAVNGYVSIKNANDSFDGKLGPDQPAATHQDLLGLAAPYVEVTVLDKRYGPNAKKNNPTTEYVDGNMQKRVLGALVNILSTSERATRRTTGIMEKQYKGEVDKQLPNDAAKAGYVGHNIVNAKDQVGARRLAYKALA